jgi:oligopeptide/dipeptide ABC transporter ATP-binding protein
LRIVNGRTEGMRRPIHWDRGGATGTLLRVDALTVDLGTGTDIVRILDRIGFSLAAGRTLGVVGESGSGKSMTALALMGLLPTPHSLSGSISLAGQEIVGLSNEAHRYLRGKCMAMIFQEPMTALNPVVPVGIQIAEMLVVHDGLSAAEASRRVVALLERVGIAAPAERARAYPHEFSGGMRQRVMIAIAIACRPALLIADEPTTALDVSVQAQILDLLLELQRDEGMAMLFISHNLGVISQVADEILVMYAGRAVEYGPAQAVLKHPAHPYTTGLIATVPDVAHRRAVLPVIKGGVADPRSYGSGCAFAPRCPRAAEPCRIAPPPLWPVGPGHAAACIRPELSA